MKKQYNLCYLLTVCLLVFYYGVNAQEGNVSTLKVKNIMQGYDFVGHFPGAISWSYNSKGFYFDWNPENAINDSLYQYKISESKVVKVDNEVEQNLPSNRLIYSADKSKAVYSKHGDIFLLDLLKDNIFRVTNTNKRESSPHFTHNETKIAFRYETNLFCWDIKSGQLDQITDFSKDSDKKKRLNKKGQWLENDQLALFEVIKQRDNREKLSKANSEKDKLKRPLSIPLNGMSLMDAKLSPDGNYVTYILYKRHSSKRTDVPDYVTKSGYTEDINARAKVGSKSTEYQIYIYDIKNRMKYSVDFSKLTGIKDIPRYTKDYPNKKYENKNRVGYINGPIWNSIGTKAFIEMRANDNKDRWLALINMATGALTEIERQHDEAWIDGPGIGYFSRYRTAMGWMPDNESIWFQSEETGYSHLYVLSDPICES